MSIFHLCFRVMSVTPFDSRVSAYGNEGSYLAPGCIGDGKTNLYDMFTTALTGISVTASVPVGTLEDAAYFNISQGCVTSSLPLALPDTVSGDGNGVQDLSISSQSQSGQAGNIRVTDINVVSSRACTLFVFESAGTEGGILAKFPVVVGVNKIDKQNLLAFDAGGDRNPTQLSFGISSTFITYTEITATTDSSAQVVIWVSGIYYINN